MLRDYAPSVEAGTTWVTGSPITAVLTLYPLATTTCLSRTSPCTPEPRVMGSAVS